MKNKSPYWDFTCESCMRCLAFCPRNAITCSQPMAFLILFAFSWIPVTQWLTDYFVNLNPQAFNPFSGLLSLTITTFICIPFFWFFYYLMHQLKRIKIISKALEYSSLTRWWKKYKAPGIRIRDFSEE